jgi:hypothetical protein
MYQLLCFHTAKTEVLDMKTTTLAQNGIMRWRNGVMG